jgi:hypothetical protein
MKSSKNILVNDVSNTVRRYPRTLHEAFPQDYGDSWWEPPQRTIISGFWRTTLFIICVWAMIYMLAINALENS